MPYYHVRLFFYEEYVPPRVGHIDKLNLERTCLEKEIIGPYLLGKVFRFQSRLFRPTEVAKFSIRETPQKVLEIMVDYGGNFVYGKDVTGTFLKAQKSQEKLKKRTMMSKNVFIVHGKDHKPVKELKSLLENLGLHPIVLHEQPSGSMTIFEKLEKYSEGIGFAFILLTADDALNPAIKFSDNQYMPSVRPPVFRARQNVILEFGYFVAKLGRMRVCCLYRGPTELPYDMPSDMHGIVYIPFKDSVNEIRNNIIKELKAAGYKMKLEHLKTDKEEIQVNKNLKKRVEKLEKDLERRVD